MEDGAERPQGTGAPANDTPADAKFVRAWRKPLRQTLINRRLAVGDDDHARWSAVIDMLLERGFRRAAGSCIAFCWPFQREYDARPLILRLLERGATAAMPVVAVPKSPLVFRQWQPDCKMVADVYGIPIPVETPLVEPDAVLAPVNGFDPQGYRLGYGAGYFDRTLAAAKERPVAIGVGFEIGRLATIYPQPHDIPLDFIVTEAGVHRGPAVARSSAARLSAVEDFTDVHLRERCEERTDLLGIVERCAEER